MKATARFVLGIIAAAAFSSAARAVDRRLITGVSHLSITTADAAGTEAFFVHDLGAEKRNDPENEQGVRYYFSPVQFIEVLPLPAASTTINRLDHVAFNTVSAENMRLYLGAHKIAVPAHVIKGADGSQWFAVADPEGNKVEFVQPPAAPAAVAPNTLSTHIIHVGFAVHDRAREDTFFRDLLGFRPYWVGGQNDSVVSWVSQQVPDGPDWLEYMLIYPSDPPMTQAHLGVLDHFSLGVKNVEAAYTLLWNGARLEKQTGSPKMGLDAKWQLNLIAPDGTRAEIMEFQPVGTPCCSPFTASSPKE